MMYINARFNDLRQLGVPINNEFVLTSDSDTWAGAISVEDYSDVMEYIATKARMRFDPPVSQGLMAALKDSIAESEWRLRHKYDET